MAVTASSSCPSQLTVSYPYDPAGTGTSGAVTLERTAVFKGTILKSEGTWAPGAIPVKLMNGTEVLATATLTLKPAACPAQLTVTYPYDPAGTGTPGGLTLLRTATFKGKILKAAGTWVAGAIPVKLYNGTQLRATATLTLKAPPPTTCFLANTTPSAAPDNAPATSTGYTKQEIRIVVQPMTGDGGCVGLAARMTTPTGKVLTYLVVAEGSNLVAKIPTNTGPFTAGATVAVDLLDTRAGDALIGRTSFRTFRQ